MTVLVNTFHEWVFKIRVNLLGFAIRSKFRIGAARQAELADDLIAEGFSEEQAVVAVNRAMAWLDRIC